MAAPAAAAAAPALSATTVGLISGGLALIGGLFGRSSARSARAEEEAFLQKRYQEYDIPSWQLAGDRLVAQRNELIRSINLQQRNERKLAEFKDENNLREHQKALEIHQWRLEEQDRLYTKSEGLFSSALGLNQESADIARQQASHQFEETKKKYAFQNENAIIQGMIAKGELQAEGQTGRSKIKQQQSTIAAIGRNQAILSASLVSADKDARMQLLNIARQHKGADLQAHAQRMLKPVAPPKPLEPLKTPLAEYELPRELEAFDFGPPPIKGVASTQVPSFGSVLASAVGSGFSGYANTYKGTSDFGENTPPNQK